MTTIKTNLVEELVGLPGERLDETSLKRLGTHFGDTGFALFTSWKGDPNNREKDKADFLQLKSAISGAGYGFIPVRGMWTDMNTGVSMAEPSIFVPAKRRNPKDTDVEDLRALTIALGKKYDQQAVIFGHPGGKVELLYSDNDFTTPKQTFTSFVPNAIASSMTKIGRGPGKGTFVFEGYYMRKPPANWAEAMLRRADGENFKVGFGI